MNDLPETRRAGRTELSRAARRRIATGPGSTARNRKDLAILLAALSAVTPLAIDAYLPALPDIAAYFGEGIQKIEMSISSFFFGYAVGQLSGAPFSDRFGRRPVALSGLAIYVLASVAIVFSADAQQLIALRFLQAFGGGFAAVNAAAIVRDLYDERDSASMLSLIGLIMMTAPLLAPALGTAVLYFFPWQGIFVFLLCYAAAILMMLYVRLPETITADPNPPAQRGMARALHNYGRVLRHGQAMAYLAGASFASGCMFVFISDAAFAYLDFFGQPANVFPLLFGANVVALIAVINLNLRLLRRWSPRLMIRAGMLAQTCACALLAIYVSAFEPRLVFVVPLIMAAIGANGLIVSNSMASFLSYFPTVSGSATALYTTAGFSVGGLLGAFLGVIHDGTLRTLAFGMFFSAAMGLAVNLLFTRRST